MSAWMVSKEHIDYMLSAILNDRVRYTFPTVNYPEGARIEINELSANDTGRILMAECEKSVLYRYAGDTRDSLPGHAGFDPDSYIFQYVEGPAGPWALLKAVDCYGYQSCEHPDWRESHAYAITGAIKGVAWSRLSRDSKEYDRAPWGIDSSHVRRLTRVI